MTANSSPVSNCCFRLARSAFGWPAGIGVIVLAVAPLLAAPSETRAGVTLLSRSSTVHAAGDDGGAFDWSESTAEFDRFAEQVGTGELPDNGLVAIAHQYSVPGILGETGVGLEGAFAEGRVTSSSTADAAAMAQSDLELRFDVDSLMCNYTVGAAVGASGNASVTVELMPLTGGTIEVPVFAVTVDSGGGKLLDQTGVLSPGQYVLRVQADAEGLPNEPVEADAYFNLNLQLSAVLSGGGTGGGTGGSPPAAVPLPPAAALGGGMLGMLALARLKRRRAA